MKSAMAAVASRRPRVLATSHLSIALLSGSKRQPPDNDGYLYHQTTQLGMQFGKTSEQIALETLGLYDLLEVKEIIKAIFCTSKTKVPESQDFTIFRSGLEELNRELVHWKPRTFQDIVLYSGYSEDSKEVWSAAITYSLIPITF